jgi:hypothetical protein
MPHAETPFSKVFIFSTDTEFSFDLGLALVGANLFVFWSAQVISFSLYYVYFFQS